MPAWLGPAITGGSSIIGGLIGKKSDDSSLQLQREALKKGIQWKVADARKAGIHPLFALGAQTNMPSFHTGSALGDGIAEAGRAVGSYLGGKTAAANQERRTEQAHQMSLREAQQRINKDIVQQQMMQSQIKRLEQMANYRQDTSVHTATKLPLPHSPAKPITSVVDQTGKLVPQGLGSDADEVAKRYGDLWGEYEGLQNRYYSWKKRRIKQHRREREKYWDKPWRDIHNKYRR